MAINSDLNRTILAHAGISQRTLNRRVAEMRKADGPMSGDEARLIIAHEAGLSLEKYGISQEMQDRVRALRSAGATSHRNSTHRSQVDRGGAANGSTKDSSAAAKPRTLANRFDVREFHPTVVKRARKPFVKGLPQDAVLRAYRSVNNRVKQMTGTPRDGAKLMTWAFSATAPQLQYSSLADQSEQDEHNGTRYLMQGAMLAMRNPRAHEDHWPRDDDERYALDCLAMASLLHRILDLCEGFEPMRS